MQMNILIFAFLILATIGDIFTTLRYEKYGFLEENSLLYGKHPTLERLLVVNSIITIVLGYFLFVQNVHYMAIVVGLGGLLHAWAAIHNWRLVKHR